jgi:hypothetical protein
MNIRDRIKDFRRLPASALRPSPRNWRTHPEAQQNALRAVLAEVGIADAVLARELADGTMELIDGHCRVEMLPDQLLPVLVLDVDDQEAAKLLATLDPLAAMAEANAGALHSLLQEVRTDNPALTDMLANLAETHGDPITSDDDGRDGAEEASNEIWNVLVECGSEDEQLRTLRVLDAAGLKYRALIG